MVSPLLETKLYVPAPRRAVVPRSRLHERLNRGTQGKLTLVAAPAGFGKTTVLAGWLAADDRSAAWLSLDLGDNQSATFWAYLVAALQTVAPGVGDDALALAQSPQPPTTAAVLATLLNELNALSHDVVVVLDDYHVIDARDIHDGMTFLLDHLPPHVHLVIASRADPPLPLPRLRARGDLVEIRANDLRFTPDETAAFLNQAMGLDLSEADVAALDTRTEGWIAGLQLAALSLQGRADATGFVQAFAGDDRYVVDYLVDEVLTRQPEPVRSFLLHTAVLDRLNGPLCDAVTGRDDSDTVLEALERDNLFVVALDDKRRWHRYHHLFADVLRVRVLAEHPDQVRVVHRRASAWYGQHGVPAEAIRHALAAEDFERAADLAERALPAMFKHRQEATIRAWVDVLPDELVRVRPVLNVGFVGALVSGGEFDGVEDRLRDAEQWLDPTAGRQRRGGRPAEVVVVDDHGFQRLPGQIELYRTALALARNDVPATVRHARRTLDRSSDDDHLIRAGAAGMLGLASWASGDLDAAHGAYAECTAGLARVGHISDVLGCTIALADIRIAQGRLGEALHTYRRALQRVSEPDAPVVRGTADMHAGMSEVCRERGDLHTARQHLRRCEELGEHAGLPQNPHRRRIATARIRQTEGRLGDAVDLLDEAERRYVSDFFPNVRPIPALRARMRVAQGDLGEALGWVREQGLSPDDDLSYLHEFNHITLACVLLARYAAQHTDSALHDATRLLDRLLSAAEQGGRTGSVIEILVMQALAHQAAGGIPAAIACLQRAVALAEPEGYVRVFLDAGPPVGALLEAAANQTTAPNHVHRLVTAFSTAKEPRSAGQGMIEPLSNRELEVLKLLDTPMSVPEIARELFVSPNTLRTHTRHIFTKLDVNNRRAAVDGAADLGLL